MRWTPVKLIAVSAVSGALLVGAAPALPWR